MRPSSYLRSSLSDAQFDQNSLREVSGLWTLLAGQSAESRQQAGPVDDSRGNINVRRRASLEILQRRSG